MTISRVKQLQLVSGPIFLVYNRLEAMPSSVEVSLPLFLPLPPICLSRVGLPGVLCL